MKASDLKLYADLLSMIYWLIMRYDAKDDDGLLHDTKWYIQQLRKDHNLEL